MVGAWLAANAILSLMAALSLDKKGTRVRRDAALR